MRDGAHKKAYRITTTKQLKQQKVASLVNEENTVAEFGAGYWITDQYENVPVYLKGMASRVPYGNVHMALRVGSVVIEIGADRYVGVSCMSFQLVNRLAGPMGEFSSRAKTRIICRC
jgi:hypothetical protein